MKKRTINHLPPIKQLNLTRRHFVKATSALAGAGLLSSYGLPL
ncbi:MAG: twin-arginine translocation signal domain-containing protein, partial [Pelagibacteraceae bacterium]|nr:twin-arginine translocation signal domain-containing protein [Pelagibacteraceae bacterium]